MKITIDINLGNDAMATGNDVAEALVKLSHHLAEYHAHSRLLPGCGRAILDVNGNTVGSWKTVK